MTTRLFLNSLVLILVLMVDQTEMWFVTCKCAVSSWTSWRACSQPCGNGGIQTRTGSIITSSTCSSSCPPRVETRPCNTECSNGATPIAGIDGGCHCQIGYSGKCCTEIDGKHNLQWWILFNISYLGMAMINCRNRRAFWILKTIRQP